MFCLRSVLGGGGTGVGAECSVKEGELCESATESDVEDGSVRGSEFFLSSLDSE